MTTMFSPDIESFIREYVKELRTNNAAVFAGAGLSVGAGFVDWVELLKPLAKDLGLDAIKESSQLVALAQFHVNGNGRHRINQRILEEFPSEKAPTENHRILARLPITRFWTTNYDKLIETSLSDAGKVADIKHEVQQLAHTKPRRDAVVFKMHGDVDSPGNAVITKDDYEKYPLVRGPFITALTGDLVSTTFLFLGFSFKDPNLDYVLSRIRMNFDRNQRQHYCIFRKVRQLNGQSAADFEYEQRKQELAIEDLKRFNVKTLLVDEYADITAILRRIDDSYRRKTVFVSGSAHSFGQWTEFEAEEFMRDLGQMIVQKGFNLVSGLGLGVAAPLISGAVEAVYKGRSGRIHDQLIVRPFPRHIEDDATRARVWEEFRQDLISQAGVALFLFGNKKVGEEVVDADGVRKEYEIAQKNGLLLAPIGGTGFVAKALWEEQKASQRGLAVPAGFVGALEKLGDEPGKLGELLEQIKELLNHVEN